MRSASTHLGGRSPPRWARECRYIAYGYRDKNKSHYEEDHLIPLSIGGSPQSAKNLWPERYKGKWGAKVKDKLEVFLYTRVCDHKISLRTAQRALTKGWVASYKRYLPGR
jgi:hypothetical protein